MTRLWVPITFGCRSCGAADYWSERLIHKESREGSKRHCDDGVSTTKKSAEAKEKGNLERTTKTDRQQQKWQKGVEKLAVKGSVNYSPPFAPSSSPSASGGTRYRNDAAGGTMAARQRAETAQRQQRPPPAAASANHRGSMPKLLHVLCCCFRSKAYRKKNDTQSSADYADCENFHRGTNIGTPPIKLAPPKTVHHQAPAPNNRTSTATNRLVNTLRQRLRHQQPSATDGNGTPRSGEVERWKAGGAGGNTAPQHNNNNTIKNNNNTLTVVLPVGSNSKRQQQAQRQFVYHEQHHQPFLLSRVLPQDANKKCLIVDLDETLVHSSFKPVKNADFVIPVEIDNVVHQVYVLKRPHTDQFLERIGSLFECVLFTASLAKYADPVADLLDKKRIFRARLFREACAFYEGNYVKDLDRLGRELRNVIIIDNSPASYAFHPDNAVPVRTWFDDANDTELLVLLPLLEELAHADNIYTVLGTVPPSHMPRCLTPSEDRLLPPPMAPSSPITQVLPPASPGIGDTRRSAAMPKESTTR